jgi:ABC-type Zn uptake system ZnuABC Zn-binding protein ZnuA
MTNNLKITALVAAVALTAVVASLLLRPAAGPRISSTPDAGLPNVAATVFPLYDIVRNVGAGVVQVQLILPANAEPHTFEPTPGAMRAIAQAKVVYAIGHHLDSWVSPLADASAIPTVTVDSGIALRQSGDGGEEPTDGFDPHYWLSAPNAKVIAGNVARDLTARLPDRAAAIAANLAKYEVDLDAADAKVKQTLAVVTDRRLATFHGAFAYFADAYGLEIAAVFEPFPGQEPTPRYLAELGTAVKAQKLRFIYHEPAFNAAAISSFATENGLQLGELDDLGGAPGRQSLIDTLIYDAQSIATRQR